VSAAFDKNLVGWHDVSCHSLSWLYFHNLMIYSYSTVLYAIESFGTTDENNFVPLESAAVNGALHEVPKITESWNGHLANLEKSSVSVRSQAEYSGC
jgi:hypothetical protein